LCIKQLVRNAASFSERLELGTVQRRRELGDSKMKMSVTKLEETIFLDLFQIKKLSRFDCDIKIVIVYCFDLIILVSIERRLSANDSLRYFTNFRFESLWDGFPVRPTSLLTARRQNARYSLLEQILFQTKMTRSLLSSGDCSL
jgi:hypothetical protein